MNQYYCIILIKSVVHIKVHSWRFIHSLDLMYNNILSNIIVYGVIHFPKVLCALYTHPSFSLPLVTIDMPFPGHHMAGIIYVTF